MIRLKTYIYVRQLQLLRVVHRRYFDDDDRIPRCCRDNISLSGCGGGPVLLVLHVRVLLVSTRNSAGLDMAYPAEVRFSRDDCRTFKKRVETMYVYNIVQYGFRVFGNPDGTRVRAQGSRRRCPIAIREHCAITRWWSYIVISSR